MKSTMIRIALVLIAVTWIGAHEDHEFHFHQFSQSYNKTYSSANEYTYRKRIFLKNVNRINKHNKLHAAGKRSFSLRVNELADMTTEEIVNTMTGHKQSDHPPATSIHQRNLSVLPDEVNWVKKGYVTRVKNQTRQCGACWAFGTTGVLEGQIFKATGKLVSLSEQNLVDCSCSRGTYGCRGGNVKNALKYVIDNNGIDTEASYPYVAKDGLCKFNRSNVGGTCVGYTVVPSGDEEALKSAVAEIGPIAAAIHASDYMLHFYHTGIYTARRCIGCRVNHDVLVVGYGIYEGKEYWLAKNSWGNDWGEDGYIRILRNSGNQCLIATEAVYPRVIRK